MIGIVASRIAERHHRPAVLIALDGDEGTGSGRSIPAFDLLGGLDAASAELLRHGGHRAAAGLTIARGRVDAFRAAFVAHAAGVARARTTSCPVQRVDAVVPGDALHLGLAEELERLAPFGMGNPEPALLVPARCSTTRGRWGRGATSRSRWPRAARARAASRSAAAAALPAAPGAPVDAAVRLEVNRYNGAVEPRLVLRHARPARPAPIEVVGEPAFDAASAELDASSTRGRCRRAPAGDRAAPGDGLGAAASAAVRDARGGGIAGLLGDLVAAGAPVLAVARACPAPGGGAARPRRRLRRDDVGGARGRPALAARYAHVVALDPPAHPHLRRRWRTTSRRGLGAPGVGCRRRLPSPGACSRGSSTCARRCRALYRALRAAGGAEGGALEAMLRGTGRATAHRRAGGRLLRVLAELGLVAARARSTAGPVPRSEPARTDLERSAAFRAYRRRLEAGMERLAEPTGAAGGQREGRHGEILAHEPAHPFAKRADRRPGDVVDRHHMRIGLRPRRACPRLGYP